MNEKNRRYNSEDILRGSLKTFIDSQSEYQLFSQEWRDELLDFSMKQESMPYIIIAMEHYKNQECQAYVDECSELSAEIRKLKNPMGPRGRAI